MNHYNKSCEVVIGKLSHLTPSFLSKNFPEQVHDQDLIQAAIRFLVYRGTLSTLCVQDVTADQITAEIDCAFNFFLDNVYRPSAEETVDRDSIQLAAVFNLCEVMLKKELTPSIPNTAAVLDSTAAVLDSTAAVLDSTAAVLDPTPFLLDPTAAVLDSTHAVLVRHAAICSAEPQEELEESEILIPPIEY